MINIVENISFEYPIDKIEKYVDYLNDKLNNTRIFSLVAMDNEEIHSINLEFRGVDRPTDVLSFEEPTEDYLGDILISIPRAKEQAIDYGHSYERELLFLITHGFLHINGYDHLNDKDEKEMFDLQRKLLDEYGIIRWKRDK